MMNEPTNRAITANTIRNVVKNDRPCWIWSCDSFVAASPVMASMWAGSRARIALHHLGLRDARRRLDPDDRRRSRADRRGERRWSGRTAPRSRRAGCPACRTWRCRRCARSCRPTLVRTSTFCPISKPYLSAVWRSTTTSPARSGRPTGGDAEGVERGVRVPAGADGRGAAAGVADGLAGVVDELGVARSCRRRQSATPGVDATVATSESGTSARLARAAVGASRSWWWSGPRRRCPGRRS